MSIELSIIIAVVGAVLSVVTFVIGRQTSSKNDGREMGEILTKIGYMQKSLDYIQAEIEGQRGKGEDLNLRVSHLEGKLKTAFEKIDELRAGKEDKHRGE